MPSLALALMVSLLAGVSLSFSFAPTQWWFLAPLSLALLYVLLQGRSPRQAKWIGWCFGLGYFGLGVHWVYYSLHLFGAAIVPLAAFLTLVFVLVMTVFPLFTCWAWARLQRRHALVANALLFAALWSFSELMRGIIMGGFPWILVGYSQTDTGLGALAPIGGVYLIGLVLVALSALVHPVLKGQRSQRLAAAALVVLVCASVLLLSRQSWSQPIGEPLTVRLAQAAIPQEMKFSKERLNTHLNDYILLSRVPGDHELAVRSEAVESLEGLSIPSDSDELDLVVWPETAIPTLYARVQQALENFVDTMELRGTDVLSGVFDRNGEAAYNAVQQLTGEQQRYRKRHLVPFGEYMPLRFILDYAAQFIDIPMSDLSSGDGPLEPVVIDGVNIGLSICYEDVYGEEMRFVLPKANLLVNVSNDAWFGRSAAPHQHEQKARMRALEFSRPMIRVTNTGVSSAIAHNGKVFGRIAQDEPGFLDVNVQPRQGETPFVRLGNSPVWLLSIAMIAFALARRRARPDNTV